MIVQCKHCGALFTTAPLPAGLEAGGAAELAELLQRWQRLGAELCRHLAMEHPRHCEDMNTAMLQAGQLQAAKHFIGSEGWFSTVWVELLNRFTDQLSDLSPVSGAVTSRIVTAP